MSVLQQQKHKNPAAAGQSQLMPAQSRQMSFAVGSANTNRYYPRQTNRFQDYYDYYDYGGAGQGAGGQNYAGNLNYQAQNMNLNRFVLQRRAGFGGAGAGVARQGGAASNNYGSYSHGSYSSGYDDCDNGISIGLLLTALLGIAVMFYTLYTKITMAGRRRRRRKRDATEEMEDVEEQVNPVWFAMENFQDFVYSGMAGFLFLS